MSDRLQALESHQRELRDCRRCTGMYGPVVVGQPNLSPVMLIGQAPGDREGKLGRPFAWTAGKTLFGWFEHIGLDEQAFRQAVYMAAVCRCFPGKKPKGGDRVPSRQEIVNCAPWMQREFEIVQPSLLIPVGKLAIAQFFPVNKLTDVIGKQCSCTIGGRVMDIIALPHPSGASTWHRTEPGKGLLRRALELIEVHSAWRSLRSGPG